MEMNIYEWANHVLNTAPRYDVGFSELLSPNPYCMASNTRQLFDARLILIHSYMNTALEIFRAALRDETHPAVLHWLMNETPDIVGLPFHRKLEDRYFTIPLFFRTDEVSPGRINEIQCPGSLWGELQLLYDYAVEMGFAGSERPPADQYATQITDYLKAPPVVDYFIDNTTSPAGTRYFIEKTRPRMKYWSIDRGIRKEDCNFIRSGAFYVQVSDYHFSWRFPRVGKGITYEFPFHILFDNKAPLILPFWSITRASFSDEIRNLFPFTTPLLPTGIELPDGSRVSIDEFCGWPRSQRSYYLKYAGSDPALSWGSKAVYRLSNMSSDACLDFLRQCLARFEEGKIWVLQKEETHEDEITYLARDGAVQTQRLRAKFSGFYGPSGCLGVMTMHRRHNKVHGQEDTVLSYVVAENGSNSENHS